MISNALVSSFDTSATTQSSGETASSIDVRTASAIARAPWRSADSDRYPQCYGDGHGACTKV